MLLARQVGDSMHGKSNWTATQADTSPGQVLHSTRAEEEVPAPDGDEIAALRAIVEGTARGTGAVFFQSLVRHLATAIGVEYAFVAEFAGSPTRVRTLANWSQGRIVENVEFDLAGTPCEDVVRGGLCHHPQGVQEKFPTDQGLVELGIESYLGVPLLDGDGRVLGHLAVFDERPMPAEPRRLFIFRIFATRAAVELERLRVEKQLVESERRYRELYEEAPNAYVAIGIDRRLLSVNHRASQLLGLPASELVDRPVLSLFAETPAGRHRAEKALLAGFCRPGGLRRGAGDAPAGRERALGQRVDEAAARGRWSDPRGALDLGRHHRPGARRGRTRPPPAAEPLPPGRDQVGPQLRGDRRPTLPPCWPCSTRSAGWRRPTPPC